MTTKSSDTSTRTKSIASPSAKSVASPSPAVSPAGSYTSHGVVASSVAVSLSLKRFKLASLAVVVVSAVVAFMVFFQRGVTLKEVDLMASEANEESQKKLLDDYNSYTGIASSAITMPIEMFTTMALQLTLLRFVAKSLLVPQMAWRVDKMTAAAAFALVFLVLNGFSALNVQLEPRGVKPVISLSDLVSDAAVSMGDATNASAPAVETVLDTNFSYVVPENIAGNLVTNTVLRTAVVPRVWQTPDTTCYYSEGVYQIQESCMDTSVDFGFPSRSWISKMLPAAPTTKTLTVSLLNGTSATSVATPQATQLPMNASMAATLVLHGVAQASIMANWFPFANIPETASVNASVTKEKPLRSATARATGILPPTDSRDEMKEREWLLKEAPRLLQNKFSEPKGSDINDTESGVSLSFSHVELSEQIAFDAVTIEAAVNTFQYTTAVDADKTTRYFSWLDAEESCGPKPWSICGVKKFSHAGDGSSAYYDLPSTIVAGRICLNGDGTETPMARYHRDSTGFLTFHDECNATSNSSMLVVSIAKRIVADAVLEKANARTAKLTDLRYPVLVNARKIYSITVGRLAWQTQDLAAVFGATCDVSNGTKCQGLQFPLRASASNESEVIVAGVDALPSKTLGKIDGIKSFNKYTPLVRIREPLKYGDEQTTKPHVYDAVAGDLLLPHNLLVNRTRDVKTDNCQPRMEQRLHITLGNHLYMEHGLQPAYTAAMFYLFQNGVVKKSVNMVTTDKSSTAVKTLSFDKNRQTSALVASIPLLNMYQSLVGCALLAIGVLATVFYSGSLLSNVGDSDDANTNNNLKNANSTNSANNNTLEDSDKLHLAKISDPRVIAQVMLDEGRFPPMFLQRTLIDTSGHVSAAEMATFEISSMTLNTEGDDSKCVVLDKTTGPSNGALV